MADDIDATIRILRKNGNTTSVLGIAMLDAADEIERLQDEIERRNGLLIMIEARDAEIERLRAEVQSQTFWAELLAGNNCSCPSDDTFVCLPCAYRQTMQEARRG